MRASVGDFSIKPLYFIVADAMAKAVLNAQQ